MDKYIFRTYLKHRRSSKGRHSIHSPFLYDLYNTCVVKNNFKGERFANSKNLEKRKAAKAQFICCFVNNTYIDVVSALDLDSHYLMSYLSEDSINLSIVKPNQISIINAQNTAFDKQSNIASFVKKYGRDFIIIDDIYVSQEATANWENIKNDSEITLSVSFYNFGLITTNKDFTKQDFVLRF